MLRFLLVVVGVLVSSAASAAPITMSVSFAAGSVIASPAGLVGGLGLELSQPVRVGLDYRLFPAGGVAFDLPDVSIAPGPFGGPDYRFGPGSITLTIGDVSTVLLTDPFTLRVSDFACCAAGASGRVPLASVHLDPVFSAALGLGPRAIRGHIAIDGPVDDLGDGTIRLREDGTHLFLEAVKVPEPSLLALLAIGGVGYWRRRSAN